MSLLAAFALIAAQGSGPDNYHAVGVAPLWQARIADGYVRFETPGQDATGLGLTVPEVTRRGFTYRSDGDVFTMIVRHGSCVDPLTRRRFVDRVTMVVNGRRYRGCGGPNTRAQARAERYRALGSEPFWDLEMANGRLYFGADMGVWLVPEPRPAVSRDGRTRRYQGPGINVVLRRQNCMAEDGTTYADVVRVVAARYPNVEGCGGRVLRERDQERRGRD